MNHDHQSAAGWRKSSYSNGQANCVEVAALGAATVAVRDSKARGHGSVLAFAPAEWTAFLTGVTQGRFDTR